MTTPPPTNEGTESSAPSFDKIAQASTEDWCERFPAEGHSWSYTHHAGPARIETRQCMLCGYLSVEPVAARFAKLTSENAKRADEARRGVQKIIDDLAAKLEVVEKQRDEAREQLRALDDHCGHVDRPCGCPNSPDPTQAYYATRRELEALRAAPPVLAPDVTVLLADQPGESTPRMRVLGWCWATDDRESILLRLVPEGRDELPDWEREFLDRQARDEKASETAPSASEPAQPPSDNELPGMWEHADFTGGLDEVRPPAQPAPVVAEPTPAGQNAVPDHTCGCCKGRGDHLCGHECSACDGSGVDPDEPDCRLPHGADCRCEPPATGENWGGVPIVRGRTEPRLTTLTLDNSDSPHEPPTPDSQEGARAWVTLASRLAPLGLPDISFDPAQITERVCRWIETLRQQGIDQSRVIQQYSAERDEARRERDRARDEASEEGGERSIAVATAEKLHDDLSAAEKRVRDLEAELGDLRYNVALRAFCAPDCDAETMLASLDAKSADWAQRVRDLEQALINALSMLDDPGSAANRAIGRARYTLRAVLPANTTQERTDG